MSTTSANIADLLTFVENEATATGTFGSDFEATVTKFDVVFAACSFQRPDSAALPALSTLMGNWESNRGWVNGIRNALIEADNYDGDGNATASTSDVTGYVRRHGLDTEPTNITIGDVELHGQPPYSGLIDDPINAANGNFTDTFTDLELPGLTRVISVERSYNSRGVHRVGSFGAGWTSPIDLRLDVDDGEARVRLADGADAVFVADGDGTYAPERRRNLHLAADGDGWRMRRGHSAHWYFDADGTLERTTTPSTEVSFERSADAVVVREISSGRSVRYTFGAEHGYVIRAESSDGRVVRYRYDTNGHLSTVERPSGDVHYEVADDGRIEEITDADGVLVCRNTYDRWGRVKTQVEAHGRETAYDYGAEGVFRVSANDGAPPNVMVHDRRGRMTAMIDGLGNAMRMTYDDADNVVRLVDRTGATTTMDYDDRGNLVRRRDPDGREVTVDHDDLDRPVRVVDRAGGPWEFGYDADHTTPSLVRQPDGHEVRIEVDDRDLATAVVDGDDVRVRLDWDVDGQVIAVIDGAGERTELVYDEHGNLAEHRLADGGVDSFAHDVAGRLVSAACGGTTLQMSYSDGGRVVGMRAGDGTEWSARLDGTGEVAEITTGTGSTVVCERDSQGRVERYRRDGTSYQTFEYDPVGRVTATVDALGGRVERHYDAAGHLTGVVDATGRRYERTVDEAGRTIEVRSPSGETVTRSYHPLGALASITDARGATWSFEVDEMGRTVAEVDPLGNATRYTYTPGGRLASRTSPLGHRLVYTYDHAGRLASVAESNRGALLFEHDAGGRLAALRLTADGSTTHFGHDEHGRTSSVRSGDREVAVERDGGAVRTVTGSPVTAAFEWGANGRLDSAVDSAGVRTTFEHDAHGRLRACATGDSVTTFDVDAADRLRSTTDPLGNITALGRDPRGALVAVEQPDGSQVRYAMNLDGSIAALYDGDENLLVGFDRDGNGTITEIVGEAGTTRYEYDLCGRMVHQSGPSGAVDYTRDADGRLTGIGDRTGFDVAITYAGSAHIDSYVIDGNAVAPPAEPDVQRDADGRIVEDEDGRRYRYDAAGRLTSVEVGDDTTSYHYDASGALVREERGDVVTTYDYGRAGELLRRTVGDQVTTYDYDALGRRVRESAPDGSTIHYRWDVLGRLRGYRQVAVDGTETERTIRYSTMSRPASIDDTALLWAAGRGGDLLGIGDTRLLWHGNQVRVASDPTGEWSRRLTDDPWGDDGGDGIRAGYRGSLACDRYLLLGDRVYDPTTRQFLSRDPLPSTPGQRDFASVYAYCWSDPVNFVDPSGRKPLSDEEYEDWKHSQTAVGFVQNTAEGVADWAKDNWKTIAKVAIAVTAVAVVTVATAGMGTGPALAVAFAAGATTGGLNAAIDGKDWKGITRDALVGGAFGLAGGGLGKLIPASSVSSLGGRLLDNGARQAAVNYPFAAATEATDSYVIPGGDGRFDIANVIQNGTIDTLGGVGGAELQYRADASTSSTPPADTDVNVPTSPDTGGVTGPSASPQLRAELEGIHGIGPKTASNVMDYISENGGLPSDLTEIPGVGTARAEMLQGVLGS